MNYQNERLRKKINIDELAELARISLSEDEKRRMSEEMLDFVEFASCLARYPEPMDDRRSISLDSLREDVSTPSEYAELITRSSRNFADGLFCVPRTVKEDE
jgi:aspartyl/glutamyl-tRNA(Asn/Gln) amidotransferase C subunit